MIYIVYYLESLMLVYFICHLIGISSSCTNPILYAFLNENFLKVSILPTEHYRMAIQAYPGLEKFTEDLCVGMFVILGLHYVSLHFGLVIFSINQLIISVDFPLEILLDIDSIVNIQQLEAKTQK